MPLDPQIMEDAHFGNDAAFSAHGEEGGFVPHPHEDPREPFLENQPYNHSHDPDAVPGPETAYADGGGDMALDDHHHHQEEGGAGRKVDTRMATERHVSRGDEPMGFVQEGV